MPTWLIVVVIVGALVGSIWWILPSPGERRRGMLRAHARQLGLRVRFTDADTTTRILASRPEFASRPIAYATPRPHRGALSDCRIWLRDQGRILRLKSWSDRDGIEVDVSASPLAGLPDTVWGIEVTPYEVALIWGENGDTPVLDAAAVQLKQFGLQPPA